MKLAHTHTHTHTHTQITLQVQGGGTYLSKCNVPTSTKGGELLLNSSRDVK